MRRFVDTLILVLVAYSVCWPVARSLVVEDAAGHVVVTVRIPGCEVAPAATVRVARTEADAHAGNWLAEVTQEAGGDGAALPERPDAASIWVSVELPALTLPAREVRLEADAPTIEIAIPSDVRAVAGHVALGDGPVRVSSRSGCEPISFDVPCDARGGFVFALPPGDEVAIALRSADGRRLARHVIPATAGVHDVGDLED